MKRRPGRNWALCLCAALIAPQAIGAGLDEALKAIDDRCAERAAEEVATEWPAIERSAEERGLEVTRQHRAAHERVLRRRCALTDRIELVEAMRDDLSDDEWQAFGGDALLQDLREQRRALRAW